jgi:hypothetical protein
MTRALVVVAAVALLALAPGIADTSPGAEPKCSTTPLLYEGNAYRYRPMPANDIVPGRHIGQAIRPGCWNIRIVPPLPTKRLNVYRYGTASPRVAFTILEDGPSVFAVSNRCFGFEREDMRRCLETEVRFRGRGYIAMRGLGLAVGGALGEGTVRGRPVRLRVIQGIDARIALARDAEPDAIFVAHRRCVLSPLYPNFKRCLRAPLWLAIRGHTLFRTATIQSPGSLVANARLRLFLAPDGVADQITSPDDERLTLAGRLIIDPKGRGSTRIAITNSIGAGRYAVVAELPGRQVVIIGTLHV